MNLTRCDWCRDVCAAAYVVIGSQTYCLQHFETVKNFQHEIIGRSERQADELRQYVREKARNRNTEG